MRVNIETVYVCMQTMLLYMEVVVTQVLKASINQMHGMEH